MSRSLGSPKWKVAKMIMQSHLTRLEITTITSTRQITLRIVGISLKTSDLTMICMKQLQETIWATIDTCSIIMIQVGINSMSQKLLEVSIRVLSKKNSHSISMSLKYQLLELKSKILKNFWWWNCNKKEALDNNLHRLRSNLRRVMMENQNDNS